MKTLFVFILIFILFTNAVLFFFNFLQEEDRNMKISAIAMAIANISLAIATIAFFLDKILH